MSFQPPKGERTERGMKHVLSSLPSQGFKPIDLELPQLPKESQVVAKDLQLERVQLPSEARNDFVQQALDLEVLIEHFQSRWL